MFILKTVDPDSLSRYRYFTETNALRNRKDISGFVMRTDSPTCPISGLFAVNDNQNNWRNKKISSNTAVHRVDAEYRFEQNSELPYAIGQKNMRKSLCAVRTRFTYKISE